MGNVSCENLDSSRRCTEPKSAVFTLAPSASRCARCPHYRGPLRGLGDAIAVVTKAVNIEPCGGCAKRREELNRIAPNPFKPG